MRWISLTDLKRTSTPGAKDCTRRRELRHTKAAETAPMQREESPAFSILRASTKRLLRYALSEIARNGGGRVVIHNDQLEMIGSRRIYLTGLFELHTQIGRASCRERV